MKATRQLITWIKSTRGIRSGINELTALSDWLLADIGLTHERIEQIRRYDRLPKRWYYDDCQ
jgi:uncharacterized protein YjiS (DUF1127 family)